MAPSSIHDTDATVRLELEVTVRRQDVHLLQNALTGDDDDVILAAERAIRDRIGSEHVEMDFARSYTRDVRAKLEEEAHTERRCQALYGPPA